MSEPPAARGVLMCLLGLALALLLVGIVSGTILRHVVQILPIVAVAAMLRRQPPLGAYAALPIFGFWMLIVVLIWLFLLGVSRIASGRYTTIEILLTFVMAGCSLGGVATSISSGRPLRAGGRVLMVILFAVLQVAAMWVSLLKPIANR